MNPDQKQQSKKISFWKILHCLFYAVAIVFLLSCLALVILDHLEMKRRLNTIDEKMSTVELTLKRTIPTSLPHTAARDNRLAVDDLHVRLKRAVTVTLQSLEKRLKVLEIRYGKYNTYF